MNRFFLALFFVFVTFVFHSEDLTGDRVISEDSKSYDTEKISYKFIKKFDLFYPDYVKKFDFYKGDKKITFSEFETLANDPLLYKNKETIKQIKTAGFTGAIVLGISSVSFLIPSIIFVALQTNFYNNKKVLTGDGYSSWLDYFIKMYPSYFIPGMVCISMTIITALSILVDLTITFALLHKYQNNERIYKEVIEKYNKKLKEKYKIMPDVGLGSKNELILGITSRF
ncbi:MAG TPA: hypothetical protein PLO89_02225 [Spirochaetota bacterium]|nr:hypothetical protein [Spirochaetota bacterium]